jgi:nitronate monooxygenase
MTHRLQDMLGTRWPIVQAPMAGSQGSALALAVTAAGGLGSLPAATLGLDALRAELQVLAAGPGPYNVNFFCHQPPWTDAAKEAQWAATLAPWYQEAGLSMPQGHAVAGRAPFSAEAADVLEAFRPPVVSFHFGLPAPALLARVKAWGAKVMSSATTVEEAVWLQAHGADVVIAQGLEAGGHRGMFLTDDLGSQMGTFALLPQVVRAVDVPVLAAGGIADEAGVAAALALGAAGVQVGTAYLLCPEAHTAPLHRAALQSEAVRHTALTNVFTGRPARGIVNCAMRALGEAGSCISTRAPAFPLAGWAMGPLRTWAEAAGRSDFTPLWAGQHAAACRVESAADVTARLARGLKMKR